MSRGVLETGITSALNSILNNNENLPQSIIAITDKYNKNLYDLRLTEKELAKINTSITNLFRAVENDFSLIFQY